MATSIDEIPLPEGVDGRLFATGFSAVGPNPAGALDGVGADTLVCLIRDEEIEKHHPDFGVWAAETDRIVRFPIADYGTAPADDMAALAEDLAGRVQSGEGLVVHCAAGLGRTSLVCTSILMHLGYDHDGALEHVRAHRQGAGPENPTQVAYLKALGDRFAEARR